ncbi:hypothetical protein AAG906_017864 [Vitis piasezkii]
MGGRLSLLHGARARRISLVMFSGNRDAKELDNFLWHMERYFEAIALMDEAAKGDQEAVLPEDVAYTARKNMRRGGKLLETPGAIYTKPLVGRVWKVLEMPRDVHTSLHYGGRHERSPRLSRDF